VELHEPLDEIVQQRLAVGEPDGRSSSGSVPAASSGTSMSSRSTTKPITIAIRRAMMP